MGGINYANVSKKDSVRFLESSIETISMAITSLGIPERIDLRNNLAKNSVTIGMTGISAELAMSAILTQANGKKAYYCHQDIINQQVIFWRTLKN